MGKQPAKLTRSPGGVDRSYSRRGLHTPPALTNMEVTTMLVLKRNINEEIIITVNGIEAVVTITEITPTAVKLGITAPRSVTVDRREVWAKKQVSNFSTETSSK